jgi:uncharacterized protein
MNVHGRVTEIEKIKRIVDSPKAEFVALYGRRRVGKTFLIKEFFNYQFTFYATGLQKGNTQTQLSSFTIFVNDSFRTNHDIFSNWLDAFNVLKKELQKKTGPLIIFIDELPWLDTKKSDFIAGLDFFWNSWASTQKNLKLFVCGSAASWMIKNLIENKGGLHNRLTARIKLNPFTLAETESFLRSKSSILDRYQIIQLYMALGGIPYYLDQVQNGLSAVQNIDALCFAESGELKTEFTYVFTALFEQGAKHEQVLRTIFKLGARATREQILEASQLISGGDVSLKLKELEESGFIAKQLVYNSVGSKTIYCISDYYTAFYLKFIENDASSMDGLWINRINDAAITAWSGFAFEQICIQHIENIKQALKIGGISCKIYTWLHKNVKGKSGAQIDLVIDRNDKTINLCEIKFYSSEFTITKYYDANLRNKYTAFKEITSTKKSVFLTLISTYGLQPNEYSRSIVQNEITMDDLFKEVI